MSTTKINILFTGATGYIGGSVLNRLVNHPRSDTFNITAIVRSAEKAAKIRSVLGINTVVGSLSDADIVPKLAEDADIVLSTADSDDADAASYILTGLKRRYQKTGVAPIFIQTSGTGVFRDDDAGTFSSDKISDDLNSAEIAALPITAVHRNVDSLLANADHEGYVKTYIVLPCTIYGLATGPLVDAGVQNRISIQVPALTRVSVRRRRTGIFGLGINLSPNVDIDECADLYMVLLDAIDRNDPAAKHGYDGYYIGETGEHKMIDVASELGKILFDLGKVDDPTPIPFTADEIAKFPASDAAFVRSLGTNGRTRGNRSRAIGWNPKKTTNDFLQSLRAEVEAVLKNQ